MAGGPGLGMLDLLKKMGAPDPAFETWESNISAHDLIALPVFTFRSRQTGFSGKQSLLSSPISHRLRWGSFGVFLMTAFEAYFGMSLEFSSSSDLRQCTSDLT